MKTKLLEQFRQIFTRKNTSLKTRLIIFTFFFGVASMLWYLNKLSYEYSTSITFPIKFENLPKGKVLVGDPPKEINLLVRSHGYTLVRYRIASSLTPVYINLSQVALTPIDDSDTKSYMLTSRIRGVIANQIKGDLLLEQIMPDTLYFEFTQLSEKKVKVIPNIKYSFERQYMLSGPITISPDSITISGPKSIIDTITSIPTPFVRFEKLTSSEIKSIQLDEIMQIGFSHRRVNINVPVEKFTEASLAIPIEVRNQPDTLRIVVLPRTVNIKCNVILSEYKNISEEIIKVYVDYNQVDPVFGNRLRVQIQSMPYLISNIEFEPKHVEFIIERL
jgi:hypothetical protein